MKVNVKIYSLLLMLLVAMVGTSCSDKELYDAEAINKQKAQEFANNFVKKYGEIASDQSWDFSSGTHVYSLSAPQANARKVVTRATTADPDDYLTIGDWYEVDLNTVSWMRSTLTEGIDHRKLGNPFYMEVPGNVFNIVPIFEGQAGFVWTLHFVIEDYNDNGESLDIKVWTKHQNIQQKTSVNGRWANVTSNTLNAAAVQAKPITLDLRQYKGKQMHIYLENTYNNKAVASASSLDHKMLALNIPEAYMPKGLDEYKKVIIACEDNADGKYFTIDNDYNDVVFMVYGNPDIPEVKEVEELISDSFSKRYMIEDLGSTDDFDFNDVVVDVYDMTSKKAIYDVDADGNKTFNRWEDEQHSQEAIIRSLGGTLDITVQIGSTTWTKSENGFDASQMVNSGANGAINYKAVLAKFPITNTDWNATANNVSATVGNKTSGEVLHITFPKAGEAPMIIGFDVDETHNWMEERVSIPSTWFTE